LRRTSISTSSASEPRLAVRPPHEQVHIERDSSVTMGSHGVPAYDQEAQSRFLTSEPNEISQFHCAANSTPGLESIKQTGPKTE
jgi:hypothetical protein